MESWHKQRLARAVVRCPTRRVTEKRNNDFSNKLLKNWGMGEVRALRRPAGSSRMKPCFQTIFLLLRLGLESFDE
jgi:hypothetical protein